DGKPAANIGIAFIPMTFEDADVSPVATAETDASGNYELQYTRLTKDRSAPPIRVRGAAIGKNQVVIEDSKQRAEHLRDSRVPARYSQLGNSGFELEVRPGEQTFNIQLKSR